MCSAEFEYEKSFITSGQIWIQNVCKVYQQKTLVDKELTKKNVFLNFGTAEIYVIKTYFDKPFTT